MAPDAFRVELGVAYRILGGAAALWSTWLERPDTRFIERPERQGHSDFLCILRTPMDAFLWGTAGDVQVSSDFAEISKACGL